MQVMQKSDFEQKNVIIGRAGETKGFGVTNDPILMSMLSTGLYANPLRTMLQEIIFNAWDAQKRSSDPTRPIDLYLNEESGLIIRDYGPGIDPKKMHEIYCIYGHSTKRDDDDQTGGFGLGSKSPYAYAESFTVTSHFEGKKSMYVMNRISEENDGGPGMTTILEDVPTSESGLMVVVPVKPKDLKQAYDYVDEIVFYSGIHINIHYMDFATNIIKSTEILPNSWHFVPKNEKLKTTFDSRNPIVAIYGGVKYGIQERPEYAQEYSLLIAMTRGLGQLLISFPANTLTPLPNREELNMNAQSTAAIQTQMEKITEYFLIHSKPIIKTLLTTVVKRLFEAKLTPTLALIWYYKLLKANRIQFNDFILDEDITNLISQGMPNIPQNVLEQIVCLVCTYKNFFIEYMTSNEWRTIAYIAWCQYYRPSFDARMIILHDADVGQFLVRTNQKYTADVIQTISKLETHLNQQIEIRAPHRYNSTSIVLTNTKHGGKVPTNQTMHSRRWFNHLKQTDLKQYEKVTQCSKVSYYSLWDRKEGKEVELETIMFPGHIVLSPTITDLNRFFNKEDNVKSLVFPDPNKSLVHMWSSYSATTFFHNHLHIHGLTVYGTVVKRKNLEKAKRYLEANGWTVHIPEEIKKAPVVKTTPSTDSSDPTPEETKPDGYPLVNHHKEHWASDTYITDPEVFLAVPKSVFTDSSKWTQVPPYEQLSLIQKRCSKMVILHNRNQEKRIRKLGAIEANEFWDQEITNILTNKKDIITKIAINYEALRILDLPSRFMVLPEFQKFLGVPYLRTQERKDHMQDFVFVQNTGNGRTSHFLTYDTKRKASNFLTGVIKDYNFFRCKQMAEKADLFSRYQLHKYTEAMTPGELLMFSQKLMRFLKTL